MVFYIEKQKYDAGRFYSKFHFLDTYTAISFIAFKCFNYSIIMELCAISNRFISNSIRSGPHIRQTTKKHYGQLREAKNITEFKGSCLIEQVFSYRIFKQLKQNRTYVQSIMGGIQNC